VYLKAKMEAGCDAVQIFDTWAGILSPRDFAEFSLPYIEQIVSRVKKKNIPVIVFPKGANTSLKKIAKCGADVVGIDWLTDIKQVRKDIGDRVAVQGNLDPTVLYGTTEKIKMEAAAVLESFGHHDGHIFNLGHGILPDINPAHAKFLVDAVRAESKQFHKR
jgi:uroporphyrinogen decarboxylase